MNILVCVKQVPDVNLPISIDYDNNSIDTEDMLNIINPCDMVAVEEGVRINEKMGRGNVTVISFGGFELERSLKKCLALGADNAVLIPDTLFHHLDSHVISCVLAKAIDTLEYDLILCGAKAKDVGLGGGQTGPRIAAILSLPFVTNVDRIEISDDAKASTVSQRIERGNKLTIECPLPALFTVNENLNTPRYPSFKSSLYAAKSKIKRLDPSALDLRDDELKPLTKVITILPPKPRQRKIFAPDSSLPAAERMKLMLSGDPSKQKKSDLLEGPPDKLAEYVLEFLAQNKIIEILKTCVV